VAAVLVQVRLLAARVPVVFWQQDVYSLAMRVHLAQRLGRVGDLVGRALMAAERWLLRSSARIVVISDDFVPMLDRWGVDPQRVSVIENWAPLAELPPCSRPNRWSDRHGVDADDVVLLYAGTLGLKHEPSLLLEVARRFRGRPEVRVIVASEGPGADWLREHLDADTNLEILPFQPYEDLPKMLGTGDVLMVLLEPEAGVYSVPSKVLTYHCAGRPVLGAMPEENLASRIIARQGSGIVVRAGDATAMADAAERLVDDVELRTSMGAAARMYAERTFDIDRIASEFERIVDAAQQGEAR